MTTPITAPITEDDVRQLRREAIAAGDDDLAEIASVALGHTCPRRGIRGRAWDRWEATRECAIAITANRLARP